MAIPPREPGGDKPEWLKRVEQDLVAGESVVGAFPASLGGQARGLLAITSRRLLLYAAEQPLGIQYRQVTGVAYEYGLRTGDVFALPNEVKVRTAARMYRFLFLGEDDAAQESAARQASDLILRWRTQDALMERLL